MKIDPPANSSLPPTRDSVQRPVQDETGAGSSQGAGASTPQGTTTSATDSVNLSPLVSQLRGIGSSTDGDIDVQTVAQIKHALANGTLTIDPGKIADGLLDTVRALLSTKK